MKKTTRILVVEDVAQDYELIVDQLERGGLQCETTRVETEAELGRAFTEHQPDAVLCDHAVAQWDSLSVLKWVRERDPGMPFIIVSGALREEVLARSREQGADDCILKDRLAELGPAVQHALRLGDERRRRLKAEREWNQLRLEVEALRARRNAAVALPICADCKRVRETNGLWTKLEHFFRERHGIRFSHALCPSCVGKYYAEIPGVPPESPGSPAAEGR